MSDLYKVCDVVSSRIKGPRSPSYYNARHRKVAFEMGDVVSRHNHVLSSTANKVTAKLAPKFNGLYVVTVKIGKNVYEIKDRLSESCGPIH